MEQGRSLILAIIYLLLVIFGVGYNALVSWLKVKGYLEGYTWLAVAVGVLATLGGVAIYDWRAALVALGAFVMSGMPMAAGSIWRHVRAREREQLELQWHWKEDLK